MSDTRLYLISPAQIDLDTFKDTLVTALDAGDVASFQLRLKSASDEEISEAAQTLMPLCHARNVAFILNDRADLAQALDTDGVHMGQEDGDIKQVRKLLGNDKVIGVTCHNSRHLSMVAGEQGADYVAFGAFYPTSTKTVEHYAEPSLLSWWIELFEIPCVAIGGITPDNAAPLVDAGADFIAVSSAVWTHPDGVDSAVKQFNGLF